MSIRPLVIFCAIAGALFPCASARGVTLNAPFELVSGDRVVFIGTTFFEREGRYGFIETGLTAAFPDADVTFRNLGWSGDNVFGQARSYFGPPEEGFQRLSNQIQELKPTVAFLHYGQNAAFAGESGLGEFISGYEKLVALLEPFNTKLVFVSPLHQEARVSPAENIRSINAQVDLYSEAIAKLSDRLGGRFLDIRNFLESGAGPLTDNGIHLNPEGYRLVAGRILSELGIQSSPGSVVVDAVSGRTESVSISLSDFARGGGGVAFTLSEPRLILPGQPSSAGHTLRVVGLTQGSYTVSANDKVIGEAAAQELGVGVRFLSGPEFDQLESLRRAVLEKTMLYFHRWRPQNETYIFGFRKHEQGQNAVEIPMFDPLVEEAERHIAVLRRTSPHRYQIHRITEN